MPSSSVAVPRVSWRRRRWLSAGRKVILAEAKPSLARKFLMAGKSGLNLTKAERPRRFLARLWRGRTRCARCCRPSARTEVQDWARGLGQSLFTGSTGRVFPEAMKASPLLRAWLARLDGRGVEHAHPLALDRLERATPSPSTRRKVPRPSRPRVTVLALGGASWARLGSDGSWTRPLARRALRSRPSQPANAG